MNVFARIRKYGHDEDFIPSPTIDACDAPPGSPDKLEALALRVQLGQHLWHDEDKRDADQRTKREQIRSIGGVQF